jgi:hypothetical protein
MLKHKKINGYDGPKGAYVATNGQFLPLNDPQALVALTDSALLTSLGYSDKAAKYQELAQSRRQPVAAVPSS